MKGIVRPAGCRARFQAKVPRASAAMTSTAMIGRQREPLTQMLMSHATA